ncbi:MAG: glutamate racemase [Candidatus Cloacimonadota bacterium]|nr:glutamate racemase [Candidatus Cloacimonadota bacterium]
MKKQPIGIFDSGIGGLTVFKEIRKQFPQEDIIYFGDTARVPYGPKSPQTVLNYSVQNARFLLQNGAKIIVVACNTSASVALQKLREILPIPIIGVIQPGAAHATSVTQNGKIGIIGTEGTIRSDAYSHAIKNIDPKIQVFSKACPLLVSLVEEGWEEHQISELIIREYLQDLQQQDIDTLVLGCTHYPILKKAIGKIVGKNIKLVDSAEAVAANLKEMLPNPETETDGSNKFYVSDNEDKFRQIATRILNREIEPLHRVTLGESWFVE